MDDPQDPVTPEARPAANTLVNEDGVLAGAETTYACPSCQALLSDATMENRSLRYCTKCGGMLVLIFNFLPLVEYMRTVWRSTGANIQPRDNADADRKFTCPLCLRTMTGHPYGGPGNVNIDTCEPCGVVWLDRNELRRIVLAPDASSLYSKGDYGGGPRR
ncbi:MAG TPA: zf-TFIIB domain-containing protein [Bryobacteraceae bacterium]|nr:zf-TFIIB domain-containing protein [Bryobacteraceae bacterium]